MMNPDPDLRGSIARLMLYPLKSCAGVEVEQALLTETGLDLDRAWMVVDAQGRCLSQRELSRMALIRPQIKSEELLLRAPGMLSLHVSIDAVEAPTRVSLWRDSLPAWDMGAIAAQWLSDFLQQRCRLVRFDPEHRRLSSMQWTRGVEAPNQFADAFPLLLLSQSALDGFNQRLLAAGHAAVGVERFRPNLLLAGLGAHAEDRAALLRVDTAEGAVDVQPVKPCARCRVPDVDPATGEVQPWITETLRSYRQDGRIGGAVSFGMNAIVRQGAGRVLRVGQPLALDGAFD